MQVYPRHVRQAKICMRGSRDWVRAQGLDWNEFVSEGLSSEVLLATGDPIAARAVEAARIEETGEA